MVETALIAGLLVSRSRRRQTEADLRGRETELGISYDASATSACGYWMRRRSSAPASPASCTTTSVSRLRCSR